MSASDHHTALASAQLLWAGGCAGIRDEFDRHYHDHHCLIPPSFDFRLHPSMSSLMEASTTILLSSTTSMIPSSTPSAILDPVTSNDPVPAHHANPVVAFIIGLAIVLLASILNAAGLNLTKLDHVRTSAIPKAARKSDWLRPLWLLGMLLYILSQVIGSTIALEYMRAEYVAPLGSTSLIFNFLFAKFLVNSPVTGNDIWGTIIVIFGVIGIVAFGSINSGLGSETNADHLTYLWTRGNWLGYFFLMSFTLMFLYIFTSQLDAVLASRADLSAVPYGAMTPPDWAAPLPPATNFWGKVKNVFKRIRATWEYGLVKIKEWLEMWTAPQEDKRVAWTLGIGWACCGGGLAGGTLVFAKASVKLITGSLSHENTGNQFGRASTIFTFILLAITAVLQIMCLNRALKIYDSTLVVPVFYGVYTAVGFLDSLIFNDEVDAYESWALFLIFVSILVLVSGVVLLTHKKPDEHAVHHVATPRSAPGSGMALSSLSPQNRRVSGRRNKGGKVGDEEQGLNDDEGTEDVLWQVGDISDEEDEDEHPLPPRRDLGHGVDGGEGEREMMISSRDHHQDEDEHRESTSSDATLARPEGSGSGDLDEFGEWEGLKARR